MIITIQDPSGEQATYNLGREAKFTEFTKVIKSAAPDTELELVGNIVSNPSGASGYAYKKFGHYWKNSSKGWAYVLCVAGHVVKIGMTNSNLNSRFSSYQAGTLKNRTKGTCSVTNWKVSETIRLFLRNESPKNPDLKVEIYALKVPDGVVTIDILGESQEVRQQISGAFEARLLNLYEEQYGNYPCLSNNSSEK